MPEENSNCSKAVGETSGTINTPNLSASLKVRCRAIKDVKQARSIVKTFENEARDRNIKNARIMAKYNAEKPFRQETLDAEGLGWKSNFTTKPLPMLIDKVAPRFLKAVENVKYLTNSAFPEDHPGAATKTEAFRREITSTIRARQGWNSLVSEFSQENALFGYTALAWLDEFHWFPKHFRQDSFFVPSGTKQLPKYSQVVALKEDFLLHELFALIEDKEAASIAGFQIPNVVWAINSAMPKNRRSANCNWERVYEDLAREANVGASLEAGALVVTVWHLLAQEVTGKVSHYMIREQGTGSMNGDNKPGYTSEGDTDDRELLFKREDQFDSMAECLAFFSFQQGNSTMHGSKGIGREIYGMAGMLDRARNEVVDRLNLAGKIIIQADDKALKRFKMSVVGSALLIGQGYTISERKIEPNVEAFLELDTFLTGLLDQMAGATTPKAFEGERVTKAQVDLFASREEESRDNIIGRFLNQFAEAMTTMQRRLCDPNTADEDAKEMQKRLLKIMTREELTQISRQAVAETVKDYTELERQQVVLIAQEGRGNPLYNQKELERRKLTAQINEEFADAVLLPDEDPTVTAEQTRLQQLELLILVNQASPVPVSPRDNHLIHLQVLAPAMDAAAAEAAQQGVQGIEVLQALAGHAEAHYASAEKAGAPKEQLAPVKEFLTKLRAAIDQLNQMEAQAGPGGAAAPNAVPGGPPAAPPGIAPGAPAVAASA